VLTNQLFIAFLGNGRSAEALAKHRRLLDETDHRFDSRDTALVPNGDNGLQPCFVDRCILGREVLAKIAREVSMMTE
jgi:hypothetical protein